MSRRLIFIYGLICYAIFLGTFLYAIGFLGNFIVPRSVDSAPDAPLATALLIDSLLLAVFAVQHSVMARPGFKTWLTRFIPQPMERSTYVLFSSLALILLFWQWRPLGGAIWNVDNPAGRAVLYALFGAGWLIVLVTTFMINHFDLFGLRQVWIHLRGREYTHLPFTMPAVYKWVRHPLYVGWITTFWATPTMTASHLLFAVLATSYILIAIPFEERDLIEVFGDRYRNYRDSVPKFIPRLGGRSQATEPASGGARLG